MIRSNGRLYSAEERAERKIVLSRFTELGVQRDGKCGGMGERQKIKMKRANEFLKDKIQDGEEKQAFKDMAQILTKDVLTDLS